MIPVRDRWLDLMLVVDESHLAPLWHDSVSGFLETCRYLGAFRNIEVRYLRKDNDGRLAVTSRAESDAPTRPTYSLLSGAQDRRLVLVFTDALSDAWADGSAERAVASWACVAPLAMIQPLPERLWQHTWLATVPGHMLAPERGAANAACSFRAYNDLGSNNSGHTIAVPVLEIDQRWIRPWAHLVAGTTVRGADAAVALLDEDSDGPRVHPEPFADRLIGQREQALALRSSVSPDAYRLACLLASVEPLTIPVMRLIQSRFLPRSGPAKLAELILAGTFRQVENAGPDVIYDFWPGLRQTLQPTVRRHEMTGVLNAVSNYLSESDGALWDRFAEASLPLLRRLAPEIPENAAPKPSGIGDPRAQTNARQDLRGLTGHTSVLILVVTQGERDAVIRAVQAANGAVPQLQTFGDHAVFRLGSLGGAEILLAQAGEQGGVSPAGMMLTAASLLRACRPDYLILVGICYGLWEEEQRIGDVLVSRSLQELDHQRVVDGPAGATIAIRRGARVQASVLLLDRFNAATTGRGPSPGIHFGLMLSANTLVDSRRYRENCKHEFPDAIGGDMEGAALYAAAAKDRVDWIVVKGISDWGFNKSNEHQDVAAANAAEFVVHTLLLSSLPPRTPRLAVTPLIGQA